MAPPGPPQQQQPSNTGLINRVLDLIKKGTPAPAPTNLTDQLKAMTELGLSAPPDGQVPGAPKAPPQIDPMRRIQQLLRLHAYGQQMGRTGQGSISDVERRTPGFARGGYPLHYMATMPGLPMRSYARGGPDFVQDDGHGSGRSDHVPARLSPGEFVMDAETTAMLGDGDSSAGARKLEQLRQAIRRHKGAALAKGKFSPNAKPPESYLPKGALS